MKKETKKERRKEGRNKEGKKPLLTGGNSISSGLCSKAKTKGSLL